MKKLVPAILIAVMSLAALLGNVSGRSGRGMETLKWEYAGRRADSLSKVLDMMFYRAAPRDEIAAAVGMLEDCRRLPATDDSLIASRVHFWRARLYDRELADTAARKHIEMARRLCDAERHPYTSHRIDALALQFLSDSTEGVLRSQLNNLDYFVAAGDRPMEAALNITVGNILAFSNMPEQALTYFKHANEVADKAGLEVWSAKNSINIAECLHNTGHPDEGAEIIRNLLADSIVRQDTLVYITVLRNAYLHTGNPGYLDRAYALSIKRDSVSPLNAVLELLLSRHYGRTEAGGDSVAAEKYLLLAFARVERLYDFYERAAVFHDAAERFERIGCRDSAYLCQKEYIAARERDNELRSTAEVAHIQNRKEIGIIEKERERSELFFIISISLLAISVVSLISIVSYRERKRRYREGIEAEQRISDELKKRLEVERLQRQLLAVSLANEDNGKELAEIKDFFMSLLTQGRITADEMKTIDRLINRTNERREDWNRFREYFDRIHPSFLKNLREKYPGLSETQTRLATYIYTGMDNHQIASFLNVRAESVKQSRWRLRTKMGLPADVSLETALHSL